MTTFAISYNEKSYTTEIHKAGCRHLSQRKMSEARTVEAESGVALDAQIHEQYADEPAYKIAACAK